MFVLFPVILICNDLYVLGIELNVIILLDPVPVAVAIDSNEVGTAGVTELDADDTSEVIP